LYLTGYRKYEGEVSQGYSVTSNDDPYPLTIFGLDKPISSNKISTYLTEEFYHYLVIYKNIKNYGLPFASWYDAPYWLLNLIDTFDDIKEEYSRYKAIKGLI
jgi:hypothetical protein